MDRALGLQLLQQQGAAMPPGLCRALGREKEEGMEEVAIFLRLPLPLPMKMDKVCVRYVCVCEWDVC